MQKSRGLGGPRSGAAACAPCLGDSVDELCRRHNLSPPSLLLSSHLAGPSGQSAGSWGHGSCFPPRSPPSSSLSFGPPQPPLKVKEQTDKPFLWSLPQRGRLQLESNSESGPGLSFSCECEDRKNIFFFFFVAVKISKNVL